ncbi:MAG TPA: type II secretion system protein GspJ [Verrucomicrobiae bacterium]|nr:type II secretion system protein GspJ [Verrucomicrobiae bacterium]
MIVRRHHSTGSSRRSPGRKALFSSVHPAPASWTAPAGFTLIEVLLALSISAIVLIAVSMAFVGALRLRDRSEANLDQSLPAEHAMDLIRRDLKNAVAPGFMLAGPLQSGAFQGGVDANDGIQIYTTTGLITPNQPWAEIQKVSYGLQSSSDSKNGGKDLIRAITRNLLATGPEDEDDQFVMSGVQSLTFSYFDGAEWLDTWDDTTQTNLPFAVRVNLQLAAADSDSPQPKPIQLLVPLMAQVDTNLLNQWEMMTNSAGTGTGTGASSGAGGGM